MTSCDGLRPDPSRTWLYRHRVAVQVGCTLGIAFALLGAVLRFAAGDGPLAVVLALLSGAGFVTPLLVLSDLTRSLRQRRDHPDGD